MKPVLPLLSTNTLFLDLDNVILFYNNSSTLYGLIVINSAGYWDVIETMMLDEL